MRPNSGINSFIQKLKTDPETQKKYNHYHGGGLSPGKAGKEQYCDTYAVP